jgi:hypothetical protein
MEFIALTNKSFKPIDESNPLPVGGNTASVSSSHTRPNDITAYSAGDVVGTNAATNLIFSNVNSSSGKTVIITGVSLEVDVASVPTGMLSFKLHLYSSAPTAIADNAAYNLPSGDRAKYAGWVDVDKPIDIGDTLFARMNNVNFQITPTAQTLYGMLETNAAYTPTAQAVKKVTIHCLEV